MRKIIKVALILFSLIVFAFFIYATIMTFGNQRMPMVKLSTEIKDLEKSIRIETNSNEETHFWEIPVHEIEDCDKPINQDITIYINNKKLLSSKQVLDNYVETVFKRASKVLPSIKCIDSIVIDITSFNEDIKIDSLKSKNYKYSRPTIK